MTKYIVLFSALFLFIFAYIFFCAYTRKKNIDDIDDFDNYFTDIFYQVLLTKWQESADWQELLKLGSTENMTYISSNKVYDISSKAIKERYDFELDCENLFYTTKGEQEEYWLAFVIHPNLESGREVYMFVLISRINGNVLSMEKIAIDMDFYYYVDMLRKSELSDVKQHRFRNNRNTNETVDSIAATIVALNAAKRYYNNEMLHLETKPMGFNEEHWLVYAFPIIQDEPEKNRSCYDILVHEYIYRGTILGGPKGGCPIVLILISRESGQVMYIEERIRPS